MDRLVVIPSPRGDGFVELARSRQGRVFRKQILRWGDLIYPGVAGGRVTIDDAFADTMIANFARGVSIVQVPKVDDKNNHTEDPDRNIGEVIGIVKNDKGVYVDIDVRTDDADKMGKTLLGASAMLHLDYTDTSTGKRVGPTLLHTAITNRPYVTNLDPFEEVIAASNSGADIQNQVLVLSPADNEEIPMTLEEMLAALKADHGIDVTELQEKAAQVDASVALSNKIQEQLVGTGLLTLSNTDQTVDADTLIGAVAEAGNRIVELSGKVDTLIQSAAQTDAANSVDKLVRTGHVLPRDRDAYVELKLSNPALFDKLIPTEPVVKLSGERGTEPLDEAPEEAISAEVDRLIKLAADNGVPIRK